MDAYLGLLRELREHGVPVLLMITSLCPAMRPVLKR